MTPPRPCLDCGSLTQGTRCPRCDRNLQSHRNQRRTHYHGDWQARSRKAREEWVAEHGWVCPGWQRPAHPATTLQLDHTTGLVLCHRCNVAAGPASR